MGCVLAALRSWCRASPWLAALSPQVVFGPAQLRTLSSTQAAAVTLGQRQWLSSAQRQALASAQHEGQAAQDGEGECGWVASVPMQHPACLPWAGLPGRPLSVLCTTRLSMGTLGCWEGSGCAGVWPQSLQRYPMGTLAWLPAQLILPLGRVPSHLCPESSLLLPPALNPCHEQQLWGQQQRVLSLPRTVHMGGCVRIYELCEGSWYVSPSMECWCWHAQH